MQQNEQKLPNVELDDRMTTETKQYVLGFMSLAKPTDLLKADLKLIRKLKDQEALKFKGFFDFDSHLEISEFKVKSMNDDHEILVTKYQPKCANKKSAVTLFFHGGGFCLSSNITHHNTVGLLARNTNNVWLSVEYRKCPEFPYPIPRDDCKSVLEWFFNNNNNKENEFSNHKVGLCGDSAGAQIAANLAHEYKDKIDYQILIYPVVNFGAVYDSYKQFTAECYILVPEVIKFFMEKLCDDLSKYEEHFSIIKRPDFNNLSKCLIIAAELDPVRDESVHYHAKLNEVGVECELKIIKGVIHGFFSQPHIFKEAFNETLSHVVEFMNQIHSND